MAIKDELLDQLMEGLDKPDDLLGEEGLLQNLKKDLIEKALNAGLTHHLDN
jgi:transposase-like protein